MAMAHIIPLPGAAPSSVQNPRWRGRYPRGVASFTHYRKAKTPVLPAASDGGTQTAQTPSQSPDMALTLAGRTHPIGAALVDHFGDEVRVTGPYGVHKVREVDSGIVGHRQGYLCEVVETGESFFYLAWELLDANQRLTHLELVEGTPQQPGAQHG